MKKRKLRTKRRVGKIRRYIKWRFYKLISEFIMRHYREEVDAYWFREYKKNELVNKTWKIEKRELEKRAGGHYVLNPKVFKVWTEDELPSDPKEPIYIFIKDL